MAIVDPQIAFLDPYATKLDRHIKNTQKTAQPSAQGDSPNVNEITEHPENTYSKCMLKNEPTK